MKCFKEENRYQIDPSETCRMRVKNLGFVSQKEMKKRFMLKQLHKEIMTKIFPNWTKDINRQMNGVE